MGPKNLITAIVLGVALAAGIFVAMNLNQAEKLHAAFEIPIASELPEFTLIDQMGNPVDSNTFRGQWDLVFFGFTHCPDVCPTTLQLLANVKKQLAESGARTLPRIVLVSVDPERDTPELLGQYVDYFGEGNLGVTGDLAEVRKLTAALGIFFEKAPTDGENYGVDHAAAVIVLNDNGEFSALFSTPHIIANFVHDLPILMGDD
jgi:protein SCO1/2